MLTYPHSDHRTYQAFQTTDDLVGTCIKYLLWCYSQARRRPGHRQGITGACVGVASILSTTNDLVGTCIKDFFSHKTALACAAQQDILMGQAEVDDSGKHTFESSPVENDGDSCTVHTVGGAVGSHSLLATID